MKILQIQGNSSFGGSEMHTLLLAKGLKKYNHEVIVAIQRGGPVTEELTKMDIPVFEIDILNKWNFRSTFNLRQIIKKYKIEIIHAHLRNADFHSFLAARFYKNYRLVTTIHDFLLLNKYGNVDGSINSKLYKFILRNYYDKIICISDAIKKDCKTKLYNADNDKFITIDNCIDSGDFDKICEKDKLEWKMKYSLEKFKFCIGFVGRMTKQKGHLLFLKAFKNIVKQYPDTGVIMIGSGPLEEEIREYINDNGLSENIILTGYLRGFYPIYFSFNLTVIPSLWEAFGRVALESMASNIPVLAADCGGLKEIIEDGEDSFVFKNGDSKDLENKLNSIIQKRDILKEIGKKAYQKIKRKYDLSTFTEKHIKLYESLLLNMNK